MYRKMSSGNLAAAAATSEGTSLLQGVWSRPAE